MGKYTRDQANNLKTVYQELLKNEKRKWVLELHRLVKDRYTETLLRLGGKLLEVETQDDLLLIILYYKAYFRVQSYIPENNPFQTIEIPFKEDEIFNDSSKEINEILDELFWWADVITENANLTKDARMILEKFNKRKYPETLFERANEIYQTKRKHGERNPTLSTALEKALLGFEHFRTLNPDSLEFLKIVDAFKKFRAPNKKKKKK